MALAGGNDGAVECVDLEPPPGQTIEIHRRAELGPVGHQDVHRARRLVRVEARAVGARDLHGLGQQVETERVNVRAAQHRLPLQRQRGDRIGHHVEQQLAPLQRDEIGRRPHAQRRAGHQGGEGAAVVVVGNRKLVVADVAQPHAVRRQPLAVVIDDGRHDARAVRQRRDALDVTDAVLQHRDARRRRAEAGEPGRDRLGVLRLGGEQHPVDRRGRSRIAEHAQRRLDGALRHFQREPIERPSGAADDVVPAGVGQRRGGDAANAAEAQDGDGLAFGRFRGHAASSGC